MICSICGGVVEWQGKLVELSHTKCLSCCSINSQVVETDNPAEEETFSTEPNFTLSTPGLEKIEPLSMVYTGYTENGISYCTGSRPADNRELMNKLNEIIEKVNFMMEVMNKGVK